MEQKIQKDPSSSRWSFSSWLGLFGFILIVFLTLMVVSLYGRMSTIEKVDSDLISLQQQAQKNQISIAQLQQNFSTQKNQIQQYLAVVTSLQQMSGGTAASWRLAEAKYLVQLAFYHLTFTKDVLAATSLLQAAEYRIAALNDPGLITLRQSIANNIAALQAVPKVDLASLLTRITALQIQAGKLPTVGLPPARAALEPQSTDSEPRSPLRQAMHDSWVTLQKIIVIRKEDQPIQPLLSPEQQSYLQQNLQLILQQAQWAALRGQGDVYRSSLQQAENWIKQYFATKVPATQIFMNSLVDLQKINVQPPLPDLAPLARKIQDASLEPAKKGA